MSIKNAADLVRAQGRYGDTQLLHVSPKEVEALQTIAQAGGKSLSVNPETGLPEAFDLGAMLPAIAGTAVGSMFGMPWLGAAVGGLGTYATTGSLEKGLMAGLGAFGGANLAAGLSGLSAAPAALGTGAAGASGVAGGALGTSIGSTAVGAGTGLAGSAVPSMAQLGAQAAGASAVAPTAASIGATGLGPTMQAAQTGIMQGAGALGPSVNAAQAAMTPAQLGAPIGAADRIASIGQGFDKLLSDPSAAWAQMGGMKGQGKNLAMMAAPFATGAFSSQPGTPEQDTGSIRQSDWNPKDRFTARDPVKASEFKGFAPSIYGSRLRGGGIVSLADGGVTSTADAMYTPGPGGVQYAQGSLDDMYRALLGRPIDQDGLNYWTQALASGASAADISNAIRQSQEYQNRPLEGTPTTASNAADIMPTGDTPQQFTSSFAVYPHPVGYNTQISYDSSGNRVYTYTPDGSTYSNVPSYEGSMLGSPITNPDHPLLKGNEAGKDLPINNVTAGMISNILKGATGQNVTTQDVYNVWGRVGSTAADWDDLVSQTLKAWQDPTAVQGTQNESQQYYSGLSQQMAQGQQQGTPLTQGQTQDYARQYYADAQRAPTITHTPPPAFTQQPNIAPSQPQQPPQMQLNAQMDQVAPIQQGQQSGQPPNTYQGFPYQGIGQPIPQLPTSYAGMFQDTIPDRYGSPSFNMSPSVGQYNQELMARGDYEYNYFGRPESMRPKSADELAQLKDYQQSLSANRIAAIKESEAIAEETLNKLPSTPQDPAYVTREELRQAGVNVGGGGGGATGGVWDGGNQNNYAGGRIKKYAEGGIASVPKFQAGGEMQSDAFVVPADVVSALGNGSTDAGVAVLNEYLGMAMPIEGAGDGLSDDIPASIDGEQPARVADGEVYIPAEVVAMLGGGNPDEGSKKLYQMLDRIREAAHGKTKQQGEVNPDEVIPR
jgi:hypothetical protein